MLLEQGRKAINRYFNFPSDRQSNCYEDYLIENRGIHGAIVHLLKYQRFDTRKMEIIDADVTKFLETL